MGTACPLGLPESLPGMFQDGPEKESLDSLHNSGFWVVKARGTWPPGFVPCGGVGLSGERMKPCEERSRGEKWREMVLVQFWFLLF